MSHHSRFALVLLTGITLTLSACATGPDLDLKIDDSERGAVYVERISDRSFQAAHPITLSTDTMARVLRGVVVKDSRRVSKNYAGDKPDAVRAFGDADIGYLAPLLVEGLTRAAADQQIGFRVVQSGAPINSQSAGPTFCLSDVRFPGVCANEDPPGSTSEESTGGSLYAYGQSLYLTLTDYRHRTERAESDNRINRRISNSTGLMNHTVQFIPESAKRPDSYRTARSTDATLIIDYNLLAAMLTAPEIRSTAAQPAMPVKGESTQRDTDLDEVRKELRDIKKKLAEQEAERTRSTPSSSPKSAPRSIP
ncbi:MAG TPA: hypothetical protein VJT11_08655 [Nitrospiraceae bacterium]|nr:hypothetical protein [Nitrospiraceae bacterium]